MAITQKTRVGIIGVGYVGGALRHWFERRKNRFDLFLYDKYKNLGSLEEVNKADIIFIAVPTPFHPGGSRRRRGYDYSAIEESLRNVRNGKVVVIKSTILPGATESFQARHPRKTILFNPEFLRSKTAIQDFLKPDRQIIGYVNRRGLATAPRILGILPRAPYTKVMKAREAEMIKCFNNAFLAARVTFANQMYDLCEQLGIDYSVVKEAVARDPRVGGSHFDVWDGGYRGYGGHCLPKDIKALMWLGQKAGVELELLQTMEKINRRLKTKKSKQV